MSVNTQNKTENKSTQGNEQKTEIKPSSIQINIDEHGVLSIHEDKFMNFCNALATSCTYELDDDTYVRNANRFLLECLIGKNKTQAKKALLFSKMKPDQVREIRNRAKYMSDFVGLTNESWK